MSPVMLNNAGGKIFPQSACTSWLYEKASINQHPPHESGTGTRGWFDAGVQDLSQPDEPPTNEDDIPDLVQSNDDDNSETVYNDDLPELDPLQIFDGLPKSC